MEKVMLAGSTFEFNARLSESKDIQGLSVPMSPADELFCNGRILPMKPSALPQKTPLPDFESQSTAQSSVILKEGNDIEEKYRGRQYLWRNENESRHRCTARSLSPRRDSSLWEGKEKGQRNSVLIDDSAEEVEGIKVVGAASPSALPKPRGSRRRWSLRDIFLPRSKSEGREQEKVEKGLPFTIYPKFSSSDKEKKRASAQGKPAQDKMMADTNINRTAYISSPIRKGVPVSAKELHYISSPNRKGTPVSAKELHYMSSPNRKGVPALAQELHYISSPNSGGFRVSAHELHYTANRAQAEELRRKTFLPYKQGVLGCLGFPSPPASMQGHVLQHMY